MSAQTLESQSELKQFLKVARPDWSMHKQKGHSDIVRACEKLKAIGVQDVTDLLQRVTANTINDDFTKARKPRFSKETMQSIRKEGAFFQSLSHLSEPSYRQVGLFAPVPQMLAGRNLRTEALKASGGNSGSLHPDTGIVVSPRLPMKLRPNTVDASSAMSLTQGPLFSDVERTRPSSMALSMPYSTFLDSDTDAGGSEVGMLPRLRGAASQGKRDSVPKANSWRRQMAKSASSPADFGLLPPATAPGGAEGRRPSGSSPEVTRRPSGQVDGSPVSPWGLGTINRYGLEPPAASGGSASIAASNASQAYDEDVDLWNEDKIETWNRTGASMSAPLRPGWSSGQSDSLLRHGEAMIREQEAHEHKRKLYQQIALEGSAEGFCQGGIWRKSPMRRHLAGQIEARLREEKVHNAQAAMEVQQSCLSIRKQISGMSNARKNLNVLRLRTQEECAPVCKAGVVQAMDLGNLFHKFMGPEDRRESK